MTAKFWILLNRFKLSKFRTFQWRKLKSHYRSYLVTVVEHSTHNPKFKGLNPATGTGKEKNRIVLPLNTIAAHCAPLSRLEKNKALSNPGRGSNPKDGRSAERRCNERGEEF